ncbi:MAG: cache domain-containing protein [Candidatus Eisenbacteria bacterium]|nr:cache domain-containing protein [Candidatus Eisenbacteria bacterium]
MIFTIRTKLAASIAIVVLAMGVLSTVVGTRLFGGSLVRQVQRSVEADLSTAYLLYEEREAATLERVRSVATTPAVVAALARGDGAALAAALTDGAREFHLDILTMTDPRGRVVARGGSPGSAGDDRRDHPVVSRILRTGQDVSGTLLIPADALAVESPDAARRARIPVVETPRAGPTTRACLDEGMVLAAGVPVIQGVEVLGLLYGGHLLNGSDGIVDQIVNTAYGTETWKGRRVGTATVFCDDVRIATTVRTDDGARAVGTRLSAEVYDRVFRTGERWVARAFVVNDWYIAAYGPIADLDDRTVGVLYVGVLADRFDAVRRRTVVTFAAVSVAGMALALLIASVLAGGILRPVRHLAEASRQIAEGNLRARVEVDPHAAGELVDLAEAFNIMASSIAERDERLMENARKMTESKKLATLGQLAAGIAHEINNPLGGIVMYSHMLKEELQKPENRENVEKIAREADRCKRIVKGLLDFARQTKPERTEADINHVIDEVIGLLEHQTLFHGIKVVKDHSAGIPLVNIDAAQIQEVFMNIIMNAAQAMNGSGRLTTATRLTGNNRAIEVEIRDTGPGIPPEHVDKIFEPFFTTKEVGRGTGLGLSIAYGIVERHHGVIRVESEVGRGTAFFVQIPIEETPPPAM